MTDGLNDGPVFETGEEVGRFGLYAVECKGAPAGWGDSADGHFGKGTDLDTLCRS